MRRLATVLLLGLLALAGCNKKKDAGPGTGTGSAVVGSGSGSAPVAAGPKCPPGNLLEADTCTPVITADTVAAIGQQQTRLDELATLLDQAEVVAAPLELLTAMRQLDEWKVLAATGGDKLKAVDEVIAVLGDAVKQLHALQKSLRDGAVRLGNLEGELDALMKDTGAAKQLADVRAQVTTQVREVVDGVSKEVVATLQQVVLPLEQELEDVSDIVIGACAIAKMQGGSDALKESCTKAKAQFTAANAFLEDFKTKPQAMITDLTAQLEAQLGTLISEQEKQAIAAAQRAVNDALRLPTPNPAAGSGAGSATP